MPGHSACPTAETHTSQVSVGARFTPCQPFLGTWWACWPGIQPSALLTLSAVILSPVSFLLRGCWENLGLLMSSFLFPNFAMVSGRISQHYLLIWDHFKVVSSAPALPRLAFLAPGRWLAHPPQMGALLCLFLWLRVCSSWSPSFTGVFPRARGRFLWPICASEDDRKPQAQACHQWVSWPREGPVRPVSDGDQEAGVPCSCAVLGREAPILTASVVSILASGPPVTTLILV